MGYKEVSRVAIGEVIRRWQLGSSQRQIASGTGLSRGTVRKYLGAARGVGVGVDLGAGEGVDTVVGTGVGAGMGVAVGKVVGVAWEVGAVVRPGVEGVGVKDEVFAVAASPAQAANMARAAIALITKVTDSLRLI